jgi:hypothetical protein
MSPRQRRILSLRQADWNSQDRDKCWYPSRQPHKPVGRRKAKLTRLGNLIVLLGFLILAVWYESNTGFAHHLLVYSGSMKEITIKIFIDGKDVSGDGTPSPVAVQPQLEEEQSQNLKVALEEVESVLENHGSGFSKPIHPIKLMSLKRKLERVLGVQEDS